MHIAFGLGAAPGMELGEFPAHLPPLAVTERPHAIASDRYNDWHGEPLKHKPRDVGENYINIPTGIGAPTPSGQLSPCFR